MTTLKAPIELPAINSSSDYTIKMRHYYNNSTGDDGISITLDKTNGFFYITPDPGSHILYTPHGSTTQTVYELKYIAFLPNQSSTETKKGHLNSASDNSGTNLELVLMHISQDQTKSLYVSVRIKSNSSSTPTGLDAFFQPFIKDIQSITKRGTSNLATPPPNWNPWMLLDSFSDPSFIQYTGNSITSSGNETDSVTWIVYNDYITISNLMLQNMVNHNSNNYQ